MNAYDCRSMLDDFVDLVDDKFLSKNVRPTMMRWPNKDVTEIFNNLLDSNPQDPSFHFLWYNTRLDPNMSNEIKGLIQDIKDRDLFDDSVIIVTADHGYPDRERGLVSDGWDLLKAGIPHDILLTNDNINVPFLLYYPGVKPGKVKNLVSTEDIVPTLIDLLGLKLPFDKKLPLFGRSLIPLLDNPLSDEVLEFFDSRVIRSDARFSLQKDRITSLQKNNFHYIVKHDGTSEELYDTSIDPKEVNNIASEIENEQTVKFFRQYFMDENQKILQLQKLNTINKLNISFDKLKKSSYSFNNCYVIAFNQSYLYETVIESLKTTFPDIEITLIIDLKEINQTVSIYEDINLISSEEILDLKNIRKKDLVIEVVDDPNSSDFRNTYHNFRKIKGRRILRVAWSGKINVLKLKLFNTPKILKIKSDLKKVVSKIKLGIHEPTYFLNELSRISKKFYKK
jgi:hypothetical protein